MKPLKLTDIDGDIVELETTISGSVLLSVNDGTLTVIEPSIRQLREMRDWITAYLGDKDESSN